MESEADNKKNPLSRPTRASQKDRHDPLTLDFFIKALDILNNLSEQDQILFINNYVKQNQVEFLATNETSVSAVKFVHEIKELNYNPEEVVD